MNELKTINIKGKEYVLVKDRVVAFNNEYPNGSIQTQLVSEPTAERVVVKAKVTPDASMPERYFTGYSQAVVGDGQINSTSALENCETSAVGRALAMMGIGVVDSLASVDEMAKSSQQVSVLAQKAVKQITALCPVHSVTMKHYENAKGEWWSHRLQDGSYCNGKKRQAQPIDQEYEDSLVDEAVEALG
ncbi:MAG: hypothetical protein M3P98_04395 [bacterium]|nr:hypothetical protein [bacterium]